MNIDLNSLWTFTDKFINLDSDKLVYEWYNRCKIPPHEFDYRKSCLLVLLMNLNTDNPVYYSSSWTLIPIIVFIIPPHELDYRYSCLSVLLMNLTTDIPVFQSSNWTWQQIILFISPPYEFDYRESSLSVLLLNLNTDSPVY